MYDIGKEVQAAREYGMLNQVSIAIPTLAENLNNQLARANAEVARLTELSKLLNDNPAIARALELMGMRSGP